MNFCVYYFKIADGTFAGVAGPQNQNRGGVMSVWVKIALFFTRTIYKIKQMLGLVAAPAALPESSGGFSFITIKKAENLNKFPKFAEKSKGLNTIIKMECGAESALVKIEEGKVTVAQSGFEPKVNVTFTEAGWAALTAGEDVKNLVMNGGIKFSGDIASMMQYMGSLKLFFLCILDKLDMTK
jgi:hypothetical protein